MVPVTIDLTGDSDVDDGHMPRIDHTTTLRANILRGFLNRSQTNSPAKPGPVSPSAPQSPQGGHPFLDMIRSQRGFPMARQPPKDVETQGEEVDKTDDDVSTKSQESSMADAKVNFLSHSDFLVANTLIQDPLTFHNLGQAHEARLRSLPICIFWDLNQ